MQDIMKQNADYEAGRTTWFAAENQFTDMSPAEFKEEIIGTGCVVGFAERQRMVEEKTEGFLDVSGIEADAIDWVDNGAVTDVKNQGGCGSCWSFSTTGSLEGAYYNKHSVLKSFSEQQLVDCAGEEGNLGCNGGLMDAAFQYYIDGHGVMLESEYPYTSGGGHAGTCQYDSSKTAATVTGFKDVTPNSGTDLCAALQLGPVSVAVDAEKGWQLPFPYTLTNVLGTAGLCDGLWL